MSLSDARQTLLDALDSCISERISDESLARLCTALEASAQSETGLQVELIEALTNYGFQLRDGAVSPTPTTPSLFREAHALLNGVEQPDFGDAQRHKVADLLERIDLEASGGFDESEVGEVSTFDYATGAKNDSQRLRNTLHRLTCNR